MPLWFVVVCAVMGAVLTYWLVREVFLERPRRANEEAYRRMKADHDRVYERAIFEAIARGRR